MRHLLPVVLSVTIVSVAAMSGSQPLESAESPMLAAARAFLETLDDDQRDRATFDLDDGERLDWHYVPRARNGLSIRAMTDPQREAAHGLLRAALTAAGYLKVTAIMSLESVLRELESTPGREATHRDPELFFFSVFGEPSADTPWGWRVEGHHLSINVCLIGERVSVTPFFLGANPAVVRGGPRAGLAVLHDEQELAWRLLESLSETQREVAIIAGRAPRDVIMSPGNDVVPETAGTPWPSLDQSQRSLLHELVLAHVLSVESWAWLAPGTAEGADLRFAWAGGTRRGDPHYYRISYRDFVIEYDNVQGGANHIHVVWRAAEDDFGRGLLAEHRAREHPGSP